MKKRAFGSAIAAAVLVLFAVGAFAWNADFEPSAYNPDVGESVTLAVCEPCLDSGSFQYAWDFDGDGTADVETTDPVVEHVFEVSGLHETEVTLTDADGRRKAKRKGILVGEQPAYAVRETIEESDGTVFVLITIRANEAVSVPGIEESMPRGWQFEVVDDGGALIARANVETRTYEQCWGDELAAGDELSLSYRLHPTSSSSTADLSGPLSGRSEGQRFVAQICGELEVSW